MRFLSVCSGIEAASVAWGPLGWKAVAFSEIEPFPCAVLAHHYPDTPNWGDMTKYKDWPDVSINLLCGGTPCQSFSVAGLRKGLDDPRGNLMLTFGAIAAKYRPQWLVWENVPGVLSSNGGGDFGAFLGMLGQLGYGFAYRVLDAQYFGVAQRRRRVFVVGCFGDWRSAAAVLFERHSLQGHPAPSREARKAIAGGIEFGPSGGSFTDLSPTLDTRAKDGPVRNQLAGAVQHGTSSVDVSPTLRAGGNKTGGDRPPGTDVDTCETLIPVPHADISPALKARDHKGVSSDGDGDGAILVPMLAHSLRGEGFDASEDGTGRGTPLVPVPYMETMPTLRAGASNGGAGHGARSGDSKDEYIVPVLPFDTTQVTSATNYSNPRPGDPCHPLAAQAHVPCIAFPERMSGTQCASSEDVAPSMGAINPTAVAFNMHKSGNEASSLGVSEDRTDCLRAFEKSPFAVQPATGMQVRRLTPMECERLQGFPDGYTNVPNRNKPAADGPRYKALGNSWAVPNVRWIGERIQAVALINKEQAATNSVAEMETV